MDLYLRDFSIVGLLGFMVLEVRMEIMGNVYDWW